MASKNPSINLHIDSIRPKLDFDTKAACLYLGISPKVLAQRRKDGRVIGYMPGAHWLYTKEALDDFLESVKSGRAE